MDISNAAKNTGVVLATASTLAYVCGYLVVRARAFALGIDPGFSLVDEGYVFAGVRFVLVTLVLLVLLSPLVLGSRWLAMWSVNRFPLVGAPLCQWVALGAWGVWTLGVLIYVMSVQGVLLHAIHSQSTSFLQKTVLGGAGAIGLMAVVLVMTIVSMFWLLRSLKGASATFVGTLSLVAAIQLFLVPIVHGALYADRIVRVLGAIPQAVVGLELPMGVVDRTNNHVTILGHNELHQPRLATLKIDDLNGIPMTHVVRLKEFMEMVAAHPKEHRELSLSRNPVRTSKAIATPQEQEPGWFWNLLTHIQVTLERIGSLGDSVVEHGQIWIVPLDQTGAPGASQRIETETPLAWPVAGTTGQGLYALQEHQIVKVSLKGQITHVEQEAHTWVKLLGVTDQGAVLGIVVMEGHRIPAVWNPDGTVSVSPVPLSQEEARQTLVLLQENRAYIGNRALTVERSIRGGRGFDVFFSVSGHTVNISNCGDDRCGQPSLSPDFRRVLFVRASRLF